MRGTKPWSPYAYMNRKLRGLIAGLLVEAAAPGGGRIIDFGCADAPYAELLPPGMTHIGVDLEGNPDADVTLAPDGSVPLPDGSADVVLSTQVLEHVDDPAAYLAECARLLCPGGSLVLTTHGIMYFHPDPVDYWRWTGDGLRKLVADAGFDVVEVRGVLGLVAAALLLVQDGIGQHIPRLLHRPFVVIFQALIAAADRLSSDESRRHNAFVFGVRAVRRGPPA